MRKALSSIWDFMINLGKSIAWARMKQVEAMMYRDCKRLEDIERLHQALNQKSK
jgi:hypothetical protein